MTIDLPEITFEKHLFTSDQKLKWCGYGEWVEEVDLLEFTYKYFECKINRVFVHEHDYHVFGGHLCGYVKIPEDHPYSHILYDDMDIDCHGGLTFGEVSNVHWIGFDCAHSHDIVPSMEFFKKTHPSRYAIAQIALPEKYLDSCFFKPTYKNIKFCMDECLLIVNQLIEIARAKNELL